MASSKGKAKIKGEGLKRKLPSKPKPVGNGHANGRANGHFGGIKPTKEVTVVRPIPTAPVAVPHPRTTGNRRKDLLLDTYKPEYAKQAAIMVSNGALEIDLITAFQVTRTVFHAWKIRHPEFAAALDIGLSNSAATAAVVRSVYEMANGYQVPATKIHVTKEGDALAIPYVEHVKKDINAAKFWLANRDPVNWGKTPDDDKSRQGLPSVLNSEVLRGMDTEQLKATVTALKHLLTPGGGGSGAQLGLARIDVEDAVVIPHDPKFKPKYRRKKTAELEATAEPITSEPPKEPEPEPTDGT